MAITKDRVLSWRGTDLHGADGEKLGKIEEIYLDAETDQPEWALVTTGMFGTKQSFVPIRDAGEQDDTITVPFDKATVKDAPKVDPDGELSQREESDLYRHYGMDYSDARSDTGLPERGASTGTSTGTGRSGFTGDLDSDGDRDRMTDRDATIGRDSTTDRDSFESAPPVGNDVSGPETDNAMTRSEEELRVGTTERETGRARLRKYIVTEDVQETVPVRREEVRVEREPITDANRDEAMSGGELTEEEHEVTLHEEEVVAEKRVVPKERVRLDKDVEVEEKTVNESVAREEIEVDGDDRSSAR